ncbi:hypothetical protein D3C76_224480 [compost metagenome]
MPVTITINGENAAQAIEEFTTLSASFIPVSSKPAVEESSKPRTRKTTTASKEPEDKPEQETGSEETSESSETVDAPSVVELRAKAQEVGKDPANKPKIKALLNKYDSPNISEVPEEKRAAFLAELEAL